MPITVKDYSWDETESTVHVTVPLKGVKPNKTDIFSTDEYLKVNYPPYLFEVVLYQAVDDGKSTAQVGGGAVVFTLQKKEPGVWSRLTSTQSDDKEVMKSKRQQAVEAAHRKAEKEREEKAIAKREQERYTLQQQMKIEGEEKRRIEETKEAERKKATEELEQWKESKSEEQQKATDHKKQDANSIFNDEEEDSPEVRNSHNSETVPVSTQKDDNLPPLPRARGNIDVTFTPRVFPTPMRESKAAEEEEWLRKQAEARKPVDIDDPDLTEEEKNPQWLKEKGDGFFKSGNLLAAVNAYNMAAKLNGKLPSVYSNRAACHLKLRNFMKCIEDSSKALELFTPPVPANAMSRVRVHIRRGTAFCEMELYAEGLQDYEAALKLDPNNEKVKADADRIRQVIQGTFPELQ